MMPLAPLPPFWKILSANVNSHCCAGGPALAAASEAVILDSLSSVEEARRRLRGLPGAGGGVGEGCGGVEGWSRRGLWILR